MSYTTKKNLSKSNSLFSTQLKASQEIPNDSPIKLTEKDREEEINKKIKNIISINLADLKEKTHKDYLQFQYRINDSIQSYTQKVKTLTACEKRLIEQFADIKIKTEKIESLSEKLTKIDDRLTTYEIRFNNLLRDFKEAVSKYDDLFLDNMNVPGKIGKYCKYKNIKEFLSYTFNKFNEFDLKKESDAAKTKYNMEKVEKFIKKINFEMDIIREESGQIINKRIGLFEKKIGEDIIEIHKKLDMIPSDTLLCDYENKINTLIDNYNNEINDFKEDINFRLIALEKDFDLLKEYKTPKNKINLEKKSKVSFSNFVSYKINQNKKVEEVDPTSIKSSNSSKNIKKYYSLNINRYNKDFFNNNLNNNNKVINKNEQNINLDNINEVYEENNDNNENENENDTSPLNNITIKSMNYSSKNIKKTNYNNNNENTNMKFNEKASTQTIISFNSQILDDSSDKESKKENIEEIIIQTSKTEKKDKNNNLKNGIKKSKTLGSKNDLLYKSLKKTSKTNHDNYRKKLSNNSDLEKYNKKRIFHSFPNERNNRNNRIYNRHSLKIKSPTEKLVIKENDNVKIKDNKLIKNNAKEVKLNNLLIKESHNKVKMENLLIEEMNNSYNQNNHYNQNNFNNKSNNNNNGNFNNYNNNEIKKDINKVVDINKPHYKAETTNSKSPHHKTETTYNKSPRRKTETTKSKSPHHKNETINSKSPQRKTEITNSKSPNLKAETRSIKKPLYKTETTTIKIKSIYKNDNTETINNQNNNNENININIKSKYNSLTNTKNNNSNISNSIYINNSSNNSVNNININKNKIFQKSNIANIKNQNTRKKIEILNNNTIKNYTIEKNYKTNYENKSPEYPHKNINYSTSVSVGNISDISLLNNIQFSNHELNRKNKEVPIKQRYYNMIQLENSKKEEESTKNSNSNNINNNSKQIIFNPKDIPFISNSISKSKSQSQSKKKLKKDKILPYLNYKNHIFDKTKKNNNVKNLELKIIPANFKESKKIQVNLDDV